MDQNFSSFQSYQPGEDQEIPFVQIKDASYFRAKARGALKGKWVNASVMAFLYQLILGAVGTVVGIVMSVGMLPAMIAGPDESMFSLIFLIPLFICFIIMAAGTIFLGAPLTVGYHRMTLEIHDGKDAGVEGLFYYFKKDYWKTVKVYTLYSVVTALGAIPSMVGGILINLLDVSLALELILVLVFGLLTLALTVVLAYRYHMVFFILAEYPEMRAVDVMRSSANMMKGRKRKLFCLHFSFVGWVLLVFLVGTCTCGLAAMIAPYPLAMYLMVATAAFYDDAANRTAAREAEFPSLDPEDYKVEEEKTDEA